MDLIITATGYEPWTDPETYRAGTILGTDGLDLTEDYLSHGLRSYAADKVRGWAIPAP